jgi:hypothetical protein
MTLEEPSLLLPNPYCLFLTYREDLVHKSCIYFCNVSQVEILVNAQQLPWSSAPLHQSGDPNRGVKSTSFLRQVAVPWPMSVPVSVSIIQKLLSPQRDLLGIFENMSWPHDVS